MNSSFWQGRPVFITGGTGLMGSALLGRLVNAGAQVVALVRDQVPHSLAVKSGLLDRVITVHGALEDYDLIRRTLAEYDIDTIFHLAAQPLVNTARRDPISTLETNVRGTWNVLEAARLLSIPQTVVASSDKAYGPQAELPYTEDQPLCRTYPYDVSKSCADLITSMYATTYGLGVSVVRCANLFGPVDLNFDRVIPGVVMATLKGERFVIRSDGKFVRDYLYVQDAAGAYMLVAESLRNDQSFAGEAFNFSLELRMTVIDLVREILARMGRSDLEPVVLNQSRAEIRDQSMSCAKARDRLGWKPEYAFHEGLSETIQWYAAEFPLPPGPGVSTGTGRPGSMRSVR